MAPEGKVVGSMRRVVLSLVISVESGLPLGLKATCTVMVARPVVATGPALPGRLLAEEIRVLTK